jgi:hypothetical protein
MLLMIWVLSSIWLSVAFVAAWYGYQIKHATRPASAHQSWFTAWSITLLLFTFYLIFEIFHLDSAKLNFLTNNLIVSVVLIYVQVGVLVRVDSKDLELWTPVLLKLIGPIRGTLTALLLSLPALFSGYWLPAGDDSVRGLTSTNYADYDIYYEVIAILSVSVLVYCLPGTSPTVYIRIGAILYGLGWLCEFISTALIPSHPDILFIISWFATALGVPFVILAVFMNRRSL